MKAGWKTDTLENCLERFRVPAKIQRKKFCETGAFPIVSQEADFVNGYWDEAGDVCVLDRPVVIFGDHTQVLKYVDFDFVVGADGVKVLAPKPFIDAKYLYYFVMANRTPSLGYARHYRHVKELAVNYPDAKEQQQIVAILDEAFEGLARARENAEVNLRNARELFESFLGKVFSQGSWPTKTLNQISENLDRVRVPITKGDRKAGGIPYYGASGVVDHVEDYLFDEDLLLVSEDGANLLARTYPIAFSISGKTWVNNHAHVLRFPNLDTQEYVRLYLNSISLEPFVSGMAQPKLNQAQLNRIPIPFPSQTDRADIVAKAELFSAETQDLQRSYQDAEGNLDDLRQSLLQKALAGELT